MTTVVLLVLAIIWGVLLVSWFRSRSAGGTFSDSVGTFRRHLNVLERATPTTVMPANRMRSAPISARGIPAYRPPGRMVPGTRLGPAARPVVGPGGPGRRPSAAVVMRRRRAQKRRRDIFVALLAGVLGSLGLCAVPSLGVSVMWPVQVLCDLLFVGYVLLLVRLRNLAAEREMKVRYMPYETRAARARPSYDFGSGYGELSLTRTAAH